MRLRQNGTSTGDAPVAMPAIDAQFGLLHVGGQRSDGSPPSADSADGKVHFTAANLNNKFHRAIEVEATSVVLQAMFSDERHFAHHEGLPQGAMFSDEGAANHNRLGATTPNAACRCLFTGVRNLTGKSR